MTAWFEFHFKLWVPSIFIEKKKRYWGFVSVKTGRTVRRHLYEKKNKISTPYHWSGAFWSYDSSLIRIVIWHWVIVVSWWLNFHKYSYFFRDSIWDSFIGFLYHIDLGPWDCLVCLVYMINLWSIEFATSPLKVGAYSAGHYSSTGSRAQW